METRVASQQNKIVIFDKSLSYSAEIQQCETEYLVKIFKLNETDKALHVEFFISLNSREFQLRTDGSFYFLNEKFFLEKIKNRQRDSFSFIQEQVESFFISPQQEFIAIKKKNEFPAKIYVYDVRKKTEVVNFHAEEIDLLSEQDWYIRTWNGRVSKIEYSPSANVEFHELIGHGTGGISQFTVSPDQRLILAYSDNVLPHHIAVHDLVTKKIYTKDVLGSVKKLAFISNTQVLVVSNARYRTDIDEFFIYDLEKKKIIIKDAITATKSVHVSVDKIRIEIPSGSHLIRISDLIAFPDLSHYRWGVLSNDEKEILSISGQDLLGLAYEAVEEVIKEANDKQGERNLKINGIYQIQRNTDWLHTAGHLSTCSTRLDKQQNEHWYSTKGELYQISATGSKVMIKAASNNGDAIVSFPDKGDYGSIKKQLRPLTHGRDLTAEDVSCIINSNFSWQPPINEKHRQLANSLLKRISTEQYALGLNNNTQYFLDCLLILMLGVESSRNNATFLTTLMLLDLIEAGVKSEQTRRSYGFDNAFSSLKGYEWNDFERKDVGGRFPMAANSAGTGNFSERASFIEGKKSIEQLLQDPQKNKIALSEIELIKDWLNAMLAKDPEFFQQSENEKQLKDKIKAKFLERLQGAFIQTDPSCEWLPKESRPYYSDSPPLQQHYEHEYSAYYLSHHDAQDAKRKRLDFFYHRLDIPCEMLPGYVVEGKAKLISKTKQEVKADIVIKKKLAFRIVRSNASYNNLKNAILKSSWPTDFKQACLAILKDYNRWLITFHNIDDLLGKLVYMSPDQDGLFNEVLKHVRWTLRGAEQNKEENISEITLEQIRSVIRTIAKENKSLLREDMFSPDYISSLLNKFRYMIDTMTDQNYLRPAIDMSITEPKYEEKQKKLQVLANQYHIFNHTEQPWFEFLSNLLNANIHFNYKINFSFTKINHEGNATELLACPSCHSQAMDMPVLPYLHNKLIAFSSPKSKLFHRPDSGCSEIVKEDGVHYILDGKEKVKAEANFVLQCKGSGKHPCDFCWIVPGVTPILKKHENHFSLFKQGEKRKRSSSQEKSDEMMQLSDESSMQEEINEEEVRAAKRAKAPE